MIENTEQIAAWRVLIVDDEPGIRDTLRGVLEDEGFAVETVASGEACLAATQKRNFACILLDIKADEPGLAGLAASGAQGLRAS